MYKYHGDFLVQLWGASGPPLEYERLGFVIVQVFAVKSQLNLPSLKIDGLNVSFGRRMVSRSDYKLEQRALWPDVVLKAFYNSGKCLAYILAISWKAKLDRATDTRRVRSEGESDTSRRNMPFSLPSSSPPLPTAKSPTITRSPVSASTTSRQPLPNSPADTRVMDIVETIKIVRRVFYLTLMKQRRSFPGEIPRGACWAEGRIEIVGQKGVLVAYASGIFDMKARHYTKVSVHLETLRPAARTSKEQQSS